MVTDELYLIQSENQKSVNKHYIFWSLHCTLEESSTLVGLKDNLSFWFLTAGCISLSTDFFVIKKVMKNQKTGSWNWWLHFPKEIQSASHIVALILCCFCHKTSAQCNWCATFWILQKYGSVSFSKFCCDIPFCFFFTIVIFQFNCSDNKHTAKRTECTKIYLFQDSWWLHKVRGLLELLCIFVCIGRNTTLWQGVVLYVCGE